MNYLAHACLSFGADEILVGNMISDFVKGNKKFRYAMGIQRGINLHRMIDEFTDHHPATSRAKFFFKPAYGLYAGAFIDIVYDHFLANDHNQFPDDTLAEFAQRTYRQLQVFENIFPDRFKSVFYYMRSQNWLYHYRFRDGIHNSFAGLVRRAKYIDDHKAAIGVFTDHYPELEDCYKEFFPAVREFAFGKWEQLNRND